MQVKRYFHIRTEGVTKKKYNGATVVVMGNLNDPAQVDVRVSFCSRHDPFCKKTGRDIADKAVTKVVPLRYLPREVARIENQVYGYELENKADFLYAIPYFLPKE